jgi:hypothetical protein
MDSSFFLSFPPTLILLLAGPEEAKNPWRGKVLRLIQTV